jgi:hypothetical protein
MLLGDRLHRVVAAGTGGEPIASALVGGGSFHRPAGRQQNSLCHPHGTLVLDHLFIGAPVVMGVLMNIDNRLGGLWLVGKGITADVAGHQHGTGLGQKLPAIKSGIHAASLGWAAVLSNEIPNKQGFFA